MEDGLIFFLNGRRPQFLKDGRQPQLFQKQKTTSFLQKWKTTLIKFGTFSDWFSRNCRGIHSTWVGWFLLNSCKYTSNYWTSSVFNLSNLICLPLTKMCLRSSSNSKTICGCLPSYNIWGSLSFTNYFRSSYIYKNICGRLPFTKIFVIVFHLQKYLRSSSIHKKTWGCLSF